MTVGSLHPWQDLFKSRRGEIVETSSLLINLYMEMTTVELSCSGLYSEVDVFMTNYRGGRNLDQTSLEDLGAATCKLVNFVV